MKSRCDLGGGGELLCTALGCSGLFWAMKSRCDLGGGGELLCIALGCSELVWAALAYVKQVWPVLGCLLSVLLWAAAEPVWAGLGCSGLLWGVLGCSGLLWVAWAAPGCFLHG